MSGAGEVDRVAECNAIVEKFVRDYTYFKEKGTFKSARDTRNHLLELQKFTKNLRKEIQDKVNEKHGHAVNLTDEEVPVVDGSTSGEATPVVATKSKSVKKTPKTKEAPVAAEPVVEEPKKKTRAAPKKATPATSTSAPAATSEAKEEPTSAKPKATKGKAATKKNA